MTATKISFTKAALNSLALPLPGKRTEIYDSKTPGLIVRVTHTGAKSFTAYRRVNDKPQRVRLGRYPDMSIEQARKAAAKALSKMADGIDPVAERRANQTRCITLQNVLDAYVESHELKPGTVKDYCRAIDETAADWLNKPLLSITKEMIERRHRRRGERSKARTNNAMRVLRALFNYATAEYEDADGNPLIIVNPVKRISATRAWYRVPRRQSVIKNYQFPAWFNAVVNLRGKRKGARAGVVRIYLLAVVFTGLRKEEGAQLKWPDIDFGDRTFTVNDPKNRDRHTLPLPDFLYDQFLVAYKEVEQKKAENMKTGQEDDSDLDYVFPRIGGSQYRADLRHWIDKISEVSGVRATLHDLRRTFTTTAESLDISVYALKRLLNHRISQSDVTAGYIVTDVERLRVPMRKIENRLLHIATHKPDAKVVALTG